MAGTKLDIICIGRASVDLYGAQIGGRLEDMSGFAKYVGGSPTNISIGCARLGLKSALVTRVGDEHMGRFIRETLAREGVDTSHVVTDPERLTALVVLGIRDKERFPLIFFRENCADMAISAGDFDAGFIASAKAVLVTGTHFSTPAVAKASMAAMKLAAAAGRRVVLDIDYRPNLWALGGHDEGENRFTESREVTTLLQRVLPHCDLVVGTEEEWHIAGGTTDTLGALAKARAICKGTFVCKRGPLGCVVFEGAVGAWEDGVATPVREIEVFNVLGAGDGFMAGFLSGWLRGMEAGDCALRANLCGALAVSRHGCAPAYPSSAELEFLMKEGSRHFALREDARLERIHWSTTRRKRHDTLCAFAFDHRTQFAALAKKHGRGDEDIARFKGLALEVAAKLASTRRGLGVLVDAQYGSQALAAASSSDLWIGRPIEAAGLFPLEFCEGPDLGSRLAAWPVNHCVKVLAPLSLDDDDEITDRQGRALLRLFDACRGTGHELLLEIINGRAGKPGDPAQILKLMEFLYALGVYPDWWKLEPVGAPAFWRDAGAIMRRHDPHAQGIIVLGKDMPHKQLAGLLAAARSDEAVKGFAVGRSIFGDAAAGWFEGTLDDKAARAMMRERYVGLLDAWKRAG